MVRTDAGIVIDVMLEYSNAYLPIVVSVDGSVKMVNAVVRVKARLPIVVSAP